MKFLLIFFSFLVIFLFLDINSYAAYNSLGANVRSNSSGDQYTEFSIWNPDHKSVTVYYGDGDGNFKPMDLEKYSETDYLNLNKEYSGINPYTDIWSTKEKITGNLHLREYYFEVDGVKVRDPYAKMVKGKNLSYNASPSTAPNPPPPSQPPRNGIVIDLSKISYEFLPAPELKKRTDSIIYELGVAGYTSNENSGVSGEYRGTFTGLVEKGTTYKGVKTGFDNIKELGVTHVQLMPIFSFSYSGFSFNWGYNPLNYNVPQQMFSAFSADDYINRITELQSMVDSFHKNGIRVIMDVVYNHTYALFTDITSKYYVTTSNGKLQDYTGCGNTVNTLNPMVSNMVCDSLEFWLKFYNLDGFRFDEMGVFNYTTMSQWSEYLNNKYDPSDNRKYLYYGEPWNGGGKLTSSSCREGNIACSEYIDNDNNLHYGAGAFNGQYRVALKGPDGKSGNGGGYLFNQLNSDSKNPTIGNVMAGFMGSIRWPYKHTESSMPKPIDDWSVKFANMPEEAVNYVSCHDNLCLWDKICAVTGKHSWKDQYNRQISMFCQGILMTSQGIPFFLQGDEFLRSKKGDSNSYNAPLSINGIDWSAKVANMQVFNYYKKMIKLRKEHSAFRLDNWNDINTRVKPYSCLNSKYIMPDNVMVGLITDLSGNEYVVIYNSGSDYRYYLEDSNYIVLSSIVDAIPDIGNNYRKIQTDENGKYYIDSCGTSVTILMKNKEKSI